MPKEDFDEEFRPSIPQGEIRPKNATGGEGQSPVVTALMLAGCVVALVFFGDEVKQYTIGPPWCERLDQFAYCVDRDGVDVWCSAFSCQIFEMKDN